MCEKPDVAAPSPLDKFGNTDTSRAVMRAYDKYRYEKYKEKYEHNGRKENGGGTPQRP